MDYPQEFELVAGLLSVPLSSEGKDFIVFFRRGQLRVCLLLYFLRFELATYLFLLGRTLGRKSLHQQTIKRFRRNKSKIRT